ncbi:helix-turn-helix domain-containing protein [Allorhodopirellula heiligendammensis]|uniref:Uncharacterized protein n=1 Tax=Allorhodopirellula heiligendammensis TaxID=2714739 RepID=A0A5C6C899_9BACT|nr:hypothetical protein Poly21_17180 [Allorhodopirellula heiligendammensis]
MRVATRGEIVASVNAGLSYIEAARLAGVSVSTAWRWVHVDTLSPPIRRPTLSEDQKRKIRDAIDSGQASLRQIAIAAGVHHSTVCVIRDRMTVGGHRPRPLRCRGCGSLINTQVCLQCEASLARSSCCAC